jgi:hypothetical protein
MQPVETARGFGVCEGLGSLANASVALAAGGFDLTLRGGSPGGRALALALPGWPRDRLPHALRSGRAGRRQPPRPHARPADVPQVAAPGVAEVVLMAARSSMGTARAVVSEFVW